MESLNACRCCLSSGVHKDLFKSYIWLDKKEVYSEMLHECFNIVLRMTEHSSSAICEECIKLLRRSCSFKQLVLHNEQQLLKVATDVQISDEKPVDIKLEPPQNDDDSDDYFLSDAVSAKDEVVGNVKVEYEEPKKKTEKKKVSVKKSGKKETWQSQKIKTLVNRLTTSINSTDPPDKRKSSRAVKASKSKLTISRDNDSKINITWTATNNQHKIKHRENLMTILKYSNALPFKNKNLLGYQCGYCDSTYPDPLDLRSHTDSNHKMERLEYKANFDFEYNVKLDITDLVCTLCDERKDDLAKLKEHLMKTHEKIIHEDIKDHLQQFKLKKGEVYDCAMCSATYETFKMLKQHMNKHYRNYTCSNCDTSFATRRSLNAHRVTHQEGSFKCDHCEKVFSNKTKKHYHEKTKHLGNRSIANCPYCNESFRSYYQRNQHLIKVHNSETPYKCNVCDKEYALKSLLMYHIKKSHLMERNCQCTECGYRFFSKKALKAHMVKHTGERTFSCEVCHKSYARKYTLREHMRIHNNDRRFKCEVCGLSFVQKCSLKSHLLSNHGITMAACDITSVS
ncbi:zinc finger protein 25 [Amyelois transitella]|uniref:zinc finger protein 25 n=1 Tax=Amyelois transitella TaxID=680683 RepID=UPI00298FBEA9|nr:zinc finger protein 25 [Amyelois transitella]